MIQFDSCDHCGPNVRAYVYVSMKAGELTYCGSCANRFEEQITLQGGVITSDFRYMIGG